MRVLVTGGDGFLGRHIMPLLGDYEVMSLVRTVRPDQPGIRTVAGDITQDGSWQKEIENFAPECCIHLAWDGLPDYSLSCCRANLDGNVALLETLVRAEVRCVVVAGSCWEYGNVVGAVREEATPVDCSLFAATKHAVRKMFEGVSLDAGFDYRWARIFFAYGPGQRSASLIPYLHASFAGNTVPILRDPNIVQDFVHVDDVARGLLMLMQCQASSGIYNLGSGQPTSVSEIANRVAQYHGQSLPFESVESGTGLWADISRTSLVTGWRPRIGIADGIEMTLHELDQKA